MSYQSWTDKTESLFFSMKQVSTFTQATIMAMRDLNCKAYKIVPNSRGRNCTLLCAITMRGIVAFKVFLGGCNSQILANFLREDLRQRLLEHERILVMDNVKFHHSREVLIAATELNLSPRFLPPYSSMLNPIEEILSCLRSRFSREKEEFSNSQQLIQSLKAFLEIFETDISLFFRHAKSFYDLALQKSPILWLFLYI